MMRQLLLDLPLRTARGRADFMVAPANAHAVATLDAWADWPLGKAVLVGPEASGKSHLARVWANATDANIILAADLAQADPVALARAPLVVEDAAGLPGEMQATMFHLHNLMAEARQPLLMTARTPPRDWGLTLPDLASRMQAALLVRLDAPDDALLRAVLVKLFTDRQVTVSAQVIDCLIPRMTRSFAAANRIVADLDTRAMAEGRAITRQMALEWFEGPGLFDS